MKMNYLLYEHFVSEIVASITCSLFLLIFLFFVRLTRKITTECSYLPQKYEQYFLCEFWHFDIVFVSFLLFLRRKTDETMLSVCFETVAFLQTGTLQVNLNYLIRFSSMQRIKQMQSFLFELYGKTLKKFSKKSVRSSLIHVPSNKTQNPLSMATKHDFWFQKICLRPVLERAQWSWR